MNVKQLFETTKPTKTVFQRKNGQLRVLQVIVKDLDPATSAKKPMFPISVDRNDPSA
jgi:hypothetical protein